MTKIALPEELKEKFRREGRKGGLKGAAARMEKISPEQRSESARKAAKTRWDKRKEKAR